MSRTSGSTPSPPPPRAALCELAFGGARVSETALQFLRHLPGLVKLDTSAPTQAIAFNGGINLSEHSMDAIASLAAARDLHLGYNRFPARLLQVLTRLEHVERLGLEDCPGLTDEAVPILAGWNSLRLIDLTGTKVTPGGIEQLRRLRPDIILITN